MYMYEVILFFLICPFCQVFSMHTGHWSLFASLSTTIGENNVILSCDFDDYINEDNIIPEMILEIRQNNTREDWKEVAKTNVTGSYILKTDQNFEIYLITSDRCYPDPEEYIACRIQIFASLTLSRCSIDPNLYSIFRCRVSNGSEMFKSLEKSIVSTKGQSPKKIQALTIIKSSGEKPGDVVQLKCIGEVESINGLPSQNIRWCKNISEKFSEISLQDPPITSVVSSSRDGCINVQESTIFYHIMKSDAYLEIMCESGYDKYTRECGKGSANSTLFINTKTLIEDVRWKVSPIFMYDENGAIDEQYFNTHGIGRTIHLSCSASSFASNEQMIKWCVKKTDNANWTKVVTQEGEIKISTNKSGEMIMFSRITYHVTEFDKVLHFICEVSTSSSSPCGSGLNFSSLTIRINAHQTAQHTKPSESDSTTPVVVLSFFLCLILITVIVLVIVIFRRGELTIFGVVIKIERSSNRFQLPEDGNKVISVPSQAKASESISQTSKRYIEEPMRHNSKIDKKKTECKNEKDSEDNTQGFYEEPECTLAVHRQSAYENEVLKDDSLNEGGKLKENSESQICDYDELNIEEEQQNYEDLDLHV
ncbi:uncharacterized protein LOC134247412 isoform X2 [Saccostrea cucullata]|uniref:uncharacterized protein LOC134247412 isoform X2 n=1 Tax=Saccostrea cuccullata TaxID=36930 RepID=UPI002ED08523